MQNIGPPRFPDDEPVPGSGFGMERVMRDITRRISALGDDTTEADIQRIMEDVNAGSGPDLPMNDVELSQDLVYQAHEAESEGEARRLVDRALKIDPQNVDGLLFRASATTQGPAAMLRGLRLAVEVGEAALGPAFFKENRGDFYGLIETRPYMRARAALSQHLVHSGAIDEARGHLEALLELNPGDNQGNRYSLLPVLIELGEFESARRLTETFDESTALMDLGRAILLFESGDPDAAALKLKHVDSRNPYVLPALAIRAEWDEGTPDTYSPGEASEARVVLGNYRRILVERGDIFEWVAAAWSAVVAAGMADWVSQHQAALGPMPEWLPLLFFEKDPDASAVSQAIDAQGGDPGWLDAILWDDELSHVEGVARGLAPIRAARVLGERPSEASTELMMAVLIVLERGKNQDNLIWDALMTALGKMGAHVVEPALQALADGHTLTPSEPTGLLAALAGSGVSDERIFEQLIRHLRAHPYWLAPDIATYGDVRGLPLLRERLEAVAARWDADSALAVIELCAAIEELGGVLTDDERRARTRAAEERRGRYGGARDPAPTLPVADGPTLAPARLGRNEPCWCGSEKKYKRCHLAEDDRDQRDGPSA